MGVIFFQMSKAPKERKVLSKKDFGSWLILMRPGGKRNGEEVCVCVRACVRACVRVCVCPRERERTRKLYFTRIVV